jgi:pyruvate formate lyase activating enzyme
MRARFFEKRPQGKIRCGLCPHRCLIAEGRHGICLVRLNRGGEMELPFYGRLSSIAMDPIEKKPLYHYYPGRQILSVGFVGCSFHCPFCQNYHIAHDTTYPTEYVSPEALVELAVSRGSFGIAYTYSEPLVHLEYVLECSELARRRGLKNVLVSNGYINQEPAEELLGAIDAANIDLKSFDPEFYRREIGGKVEEVKRFIAQAAGRIALEVTTLVIPGKNDSPEEMERLTAFLAGLSPELPLHLSAYYPHYRYTLPPTPPSTLRRLAEVARRNLRYVYLGNIGMEEADTSCPSCGNLLVKRRGYFVSVKGIREGRCSRCGAPAPVAGA